LAYLEATFAQESGHVTIDARRCREIESPDERLACLERQIDDAQSRGSTVPAAAVPAPSSQPSTPAPAVDVAKLPAEGAPTEKPGQTEWVGIITALKQREPNQYLITLDTGQMWLQRGSDRYMLRVGQRVRIEQTRFGTRLQADGVNGYIHVERVR
jgi:hypothetical protein